MKWLPYYLAVTSISLSVIAQFLLKSGLKRVSSQLAAAEQSSARYFLNILSEPYILMGFSLFGLGAFIWLGVLAKLDVSKAYPLVGVGFALTAMFGWILGEEITLTRWVGVALICGGVALVGRS